MRKEILKELFWVGSSLKDLKTMPAEVMDAVGYALYEVQQGKFPRNAKPLTGVGAGVTEMVCDFDKSTYRAVYTAKIGDTVYVLHCFQKKSKHGIATPQKDIDLIKQRLMEAKRAHQEG